MKTLLILLVAGLCLSVESYGEDYGQYATRKARGSTAADTVRLEDVARIKRDWKKPEQFLFDRRAPFLYVFTLTSGNYWTEAIRPADQACLIDQIREDLTFKANIIILYTNHKHTEAYGFFEKRLKEVMKNEKTKVIFVRDDIDSSTEDFKGVMKICRPNWVWPGDEEDDSDR